MVSRVIDTQARIRKGTLVLFSLSEALSKMPDSAAKGELMVKFEDVLSRLAALEDELGHIDEVMCWFGFAPKCPGCLCEDCRYLANVVKMGYIPYVDQFDAERVAKAKQYYETKYGQYTDDDFR